MSAPHDAIAPVSFLLGTWKGQGRGHYPTIEDFAYEEEVTFTHSGKPFLIYSQRTQSPEGMPMHAETGYLRPVDGRIELVLAHPFGAVEICEGILDDHRIELASTSVATTSSAKLLEATRRIIEVAGDELNYDFFMAAVGQALEHHLSATLRKV